MPNRHLLMMTRENYGKTERGEKTQTRRCNPRWMKVKAGDALYFRKDYKTTYATALGPYAATEDARWENVHDISEGDAMMEGAEPMRTHNGWSFYCGFKQLWDSINGKKVGHRWQDNPRVVRINWGKP